MSTPKNCLECKGTAKSNTLVNVFDLFDRNTHGHMLCQQCGISFDSDVNQFIDLKLATEEIKQINDLETYRKIFVETSNIGDIDGNVYTDFEWADNEQLKSGVAKHAIQVISKHFPNRTQRMTPSS